eukprot:scaffold1196_cov151-Pinguiococcus_pyrenoidosus.AAC.3
MVYDVYNLILPGVAGEMGGDMENRDAVLEASALTMAYFLDGLSGVRINQFLDMAHSGGGRRSSRRRRSKPRKLKLSRKRRRRTRRSFR